MKTLRKALDELSESEERLAKLAHLAGLEMGVDSIGLIILPNQYGK